MNIGEKIKELRKTKNLSQETLADVLNVSRQTISKWETGESNPDFDKIVPLCDFFGISTDELLKGEKFYLERSIVKEKTKNKALTISLCIIIFVVMMILVITIDEVGGNDPLTAAILLIGLGAISIILVYYNLSKPIIEKAPPKAPTNDKKRLVYSIINMLSIIIYFLYSFFFNAWAYSWIIFIINVLIKRIFDLAVLLRSDNYEK